MSIRLRTLLVWLVVASASCSGRSGSPTAPSDDASGRSVQGRTTSAIDGGAAGGVTVRVGGKSTVSDSTGAFRIDDPPPGEQGVLLSSAATVERETRVSSPARDLMLSLIPASFDLRAFDEMFRTSNARLQRWTVAPELVVLRSVMQYRNGADDEFIATGEQLTDAELDALVSDLTSALTLLTGNTFTAFARVERETVAEGGRTKTLRTGQIVVGRYRGVQGLANTIGYGRWANRSDGTVIGGTVVLDRDFDRASELRRLLRTHELGHALGYTHVESRVSIMNPAIGPEPTEFDRQGATIAFQRPPGNRSPDRDPTQAGGLITSGDADIRWSPPTVCGKR